MKGEKEIIKEFNRIGQSLNQSLWDLYLLKRKVEKLKEMKEWKEK